MRDNEKRRAKWNRIEGLANVAYDIRSGGKKKSVDRVEMEIEFIYYARLECVSKLDGRR